MGSPLYLQPETIEDAIDAVSRNGARVVAGGTDLYPAWGDRLPDGDLVDLGRIGSLREIGPCPDGWLIGAGATWSDILKATLPPAFDGLKAAARDVGSVQIQNRATLVGNICNASPAADGVPPLLALDAMMVLVGPRGVRRAPVADFVRGPRRTALREGEIVTGILVPASAADLSSAFLKLGARRYLVISIVMVAVALRRDGEGRIRDARVAVGAASPVARRLPALEAALEGIEARNLDADFVTPDHLAPLAPLTDVRASAGYRTDAVAELCRRAVLSALHEEPA
jgi:CO/xanthine dehydrogenase FAD-binding subunit